MTSALAVCHAVDLNSIFAEFDRVLRPGGRVVLSDPHPTASHLGGQAFFPGDGFEMPFVHNHAHPISDYVMAMIGSGFRIDAMIELPYERATIETNPGFQFYPDTVVGGLEGLPFVLIWEATLQ